MTTPDNPPAVSEAAAIAAKLTEAERDALSRGDCKRVGNDFCVCQSDARASLTDLRLVKSQDTSVDVAWLITPLGLAVRAHLLGESGK